jgi:hypothetical protein
MPETTISRLAARKAIENLSEGEPPGDEIGAFISVGIENDLKIFDSEYFAKDALLPNTDQGTFKIVEAYYGGGKSHYLKSSVRLARSRGFADAFIELKKDSCPLTRFDLIYTAVATALSVVLPDGRTAGPGIDAIIRAWTSPPDGSETEPLV